MGDDTTGRRRHGKEQRLDEAIEAAELAERLAASRALNADARLKSAEAQIADADKQTEHADSHMAAAIAHMEAAKAHMLDADERGHVAEDLLARADEQMAKAAARLVEAEDDSDEYQRALHDYTQLLRHRMANPLQVICGALSMLKHTRDLSTDQRMKLIDSAYDQAQVLERVCLTPVVQTDAESILRPKPFD